MSNRRLSDPPAVPLLAPVDLDGLGHAVLTLARELWVVIDRQAVTEALLAEAGITASHIDAFVRDAEFEAALAMRRAALLDAVVGAMMPAHEPPT